MRVLQSTLHVRARPALQRYGRVVVRAEPSEELPTPKETLTVTAEAVPEEPSTDEEKYELKVTGERFKVAEGQLGAIVGASLGLLLRPGSAITVAGYKPSLGEKKEGQYTLQAVGNRMIEETSSVLASFKRPEKPIILYEFDPCPFCKKVREMVTYLDLDVLFYPTPRDGPHFRPEAIEKGGKSQFPYMVDPNTGTSMYESDEIIKYLADTYGDGSVPLALRLGAATVITAGLAGVGRFGKGGRYSPSTLPGKPLVVWGYEASPFCRVVRERLCELEIPHVWKSCARGSPKRQQMFDKYGKFQVPLLEDPNTKVAMFESAEIIKYLDETYARSTPSV